MPGAMELRIHSSRPASGIAMAACPMVRSGTSQCSRVLTSWCSDGDRKDAGGGGLNSSRSQARTVRTTG